MQRSHFRLWGIPVRIDPSFALVALFGFSAGSVSLAVTWVVVVFVTTLVHELGHAVAFRTFGSDATITLWGLGGLTHGDGRPLSRGKDVIVAVAGPLAGMILVGVPALIARSVLAPDADALDLLVWVAITWSAVNLLPVLPLDGGHVLASVLEGLFGTSGARAARIVSIVVAGAGGGYALSQGYTFAAIFGAFFVAQNVGELSRLREIPLAETLQEGHRRLDANDASTALRIAEDVLARSRSDAVRSAAIELSAWAHLAAGRRADAGTAIERLPKDMRPSRALLACFLIADGHREAAIEAAADALAEGAPPNGQLAHALDRAGLTAEVAQRSAAKGQSASGPE